jgi:hypothetical protein
MVLQPRIPNTYTKRPIHSKFFEREMGVVFFLGVVAALIGVIYLLSFLGD